MFDGISKMIGYVSQIFNQSEIIPLTWRTAVTLKFVITSVLLLSCMRLAIWKLKYTCTSTTLRLKYVYFCEWNKTRYAFGVFFLRLWLTKLMLRSRFVFSSSRNAHSCPNPKLSVFKARWLRQRGLFSSKHVTMCGRVAVRNRYFSFNFDSIATKILHNLEQTLPSPACARRDDSSNFKLIFGQKCKKKNIQFFTWAII